MDSNMLGCSCAMAINLLSTSSCIETSNTKQLEIILICIVLPQKYNLLHACLAMQQIALEPAPWLSCSQPRQYIIPFNYLVRNNFTIVRFKLLFLSTSTVLYYCIASALPRSPPFSILFHGNTILVASELICSLQYLRK